MSLITRKSRDQVSIRCGPTRAGERGNRSLSTRDETEAKQICVHLETINKTPSIWDATPGDPRIFEFHPRACEIFFGFRPDDLKTELKIDIGETGEDVRGS